MKISFDHVWFHYNSLLSNQIDVLKDINLNIFDGEFIAIVGPSGSGKTTLLQHFTGLLRPSSGHIYVDDHDIWAKDYPIAELRRRIGLVFQFPENQLFERTVYLDVAFAPLMQRLSADEVYRRVIESLNQVGLAAEQIQMRSPHQLSQGEKRRVAIAGVLAMNPEMLVLDEPTAGLDPLGARTLLQLLEQIHSNGKTIVLISHHLDLVFQFAHRLIILNQGQIIFDGDTKHIFDDRKLLDQAQLELPRIIKLFHYLQNRQSRQMDGNFSFQAFQNIFKNMLPEVKSFNSSGE
ncbi:MAG: energy-coupling factor ABC transporter ATP-binding protein [candidate division KSB1 bacterium]|nr:energy-coupling factor ABC transporter ATP-binding protein [candidate division KSB1 bacterium]MDZ7333950.1 energy-coupling factor ABC transporter ATP-binding protein [candidate division KSB1 bacterium]MDZ7356746.1 energy-coupling factor ABC transporter ATP-binding protein [candidate division KSB1 bacterium]MDZ7399935.1 energy-coupling factor ABC transporter ATP-binding protein [candidate division KSB1 bacterium]